ncbi:MAG TPA: amino acid adenylation domain-containing protein, partial [Longimicrobium sp.]|nr:amino acid adenylation domain-containing protein [Longimicrobium sp.]
GPLLWALLVRLGSVHHRLAVSMHHIVADDWSAQVLVREVSALYAAFAEGRPSPLADLPVQYADYAAWQREWLEGEVLDAQLAYWERRLAGAPPLLEVPTDRPRPQARTARAGHVPFTLSPEASQALRALSRSEGTTVFMTLLAGWQALLSRWSGEEDVLVGTPVAGRTRGELEGLIGFFVNTLVLRADLSDDPSARELLARARTAVLEAQAHQDVPFERVVEELGVERSPSYTPLFQAMFSFHASALGEQPLRLEGVRVEAIEGGEPPAKFDLTLGAWDDGTRIGGALEYRADLWEAATAERMAAHLVLLLQAFAADPDQRVSDISLLAGAAVEAAGEAAPAPVIHRAFEARARRTPGAAALTFAGESLSYGELDARAGRLARRLAREGVGPEARVGILLERGPELVVALLAVLKAGGAYVPVDPAYPADRIAYVLSDSGAVLLLTQESLAERAASSGVPLLRLDAEREALDAEDAAALRPAAVDPENLAYVIYTSGSTGRPKGVGVTHANVLRLFTATDAWFGFGADDVWTLFHSAAFDFSVWEIWGALLYGGRLVVVPFEVSRTPEAFHRLLADEGVTVLNQTPSAFLPLIQADEAADGARELALRCVIFGGEALEPAALRAWVARHGDLRPVLVNMYGITETTVHVTYRVIGRGDVEGGAASVIGTAIPDLGVKVLDRRGRAQPDGIAGEMYVTGAGVARGYLGRPALTAERFVPDPFSGAPGARMYRSGDRARWSASGELEYLGRLDHQVKLRGFRIELGEIEAALLSHPAVRESAVLLREDRPGNPWLVAYLVAREGEAPGAAELRAHLGGRLPEYMVPGAFVALEAMPLTGNGKLDRRALPAPAAEGGGRALPPRDLLEMRLAGLFEELLGRSPVGVRDSFFALGGHSILAVRLVSRIEALTGLRLPLAALFGAGTVESLAALLRAGGAGAASTGPLVAIRGAGTARPLFLVHPAGGNVLAYAALARHLPPEQPVYALQARGLEEGEAPPGASVEAMADDYLRALRAVQPHGPYRLGGWSLGGVVAWEMASRLEAAGETVEALALIDSTPLASDEPDDELALLADFARHLEVDVSRIPVTPDEARAMDPAERLAHLHRAAVEAGAAPPDLDPAALRRAHDVYLACVSAARRHHPRRRHGPAVLLRAAGGTLAEDGGWTPHLEGALEVRPVPGDHFDCVKEPNVRSLAEQITHLLHPRERLS